MAGHEPVEDREQAVSVDENDEGYAELEGSSTSSLRSSIFNYPVENGRQYHAYKSGMYSRPNDEDELDRLDLVHAMFNLVTEGRLHLAPIGNSPQRILDIGCGTGLWCIEIGDTYPSAEIIGIDLSPTQPIMVPPNVQFEIDDIEEDWTFRRPFDYIHSRYMAGAIQDWPRLMEQCFQHTKSGGWVEFHDFDPDYYSQDGTLPKDCPLLKWLNYCREACEKRQRTLNPGGRLGQWMRDAGFVNVHVEKKVLPIGPWPKDSRLKKIGLFNATQLHDGLSGLSMRLFTNVLGWTREEVEVFLVDVRKDLKNPQIHALMDFFIAYGQKP
ncbi:hypothetical protein T310_2883 [Rasamsonia emersonii CBS 393.64]|uniref:Methyltransferase n=1 Tax=Rasamsonia emersonii (strain ATCC 16479 / CBS 393.64 / IMI 116815) TaxID=1408163 RepID=A0A0F4YY01_RASE3|nr:hypothetical protein T310_2883 [Rasamsonia emersonii CBS 393.64]KKA23157.1 hypothetical protein T310_2883 [Rasamsonia emersonii CBS 393.64]